MAKPKKILIVDDEPDILKIASSELKKAKYEVVTAAKGEEAVATAVKESPDIILLDIGLPDIDGHEVCRRLKANEGLKEIPIIIFTAKYEADIPHEKWTMPIEGYLVKPFGKEELLDIVNYVLSK